MTINIILAASIYYNAHIDIILDFKKNIALQAWTIINYLLDLLRYEAIKKNNMSAKILFIKYNVKKIFPNTMVS